MQIGDQVICVDATPCTCPGLPDLKLGAIYTIRDIDRRACPYVEATVRLLEIVGPVTPSCLGPWEAGYREDRFRPLRKTDISIFTAMTRELQVAA